MKTLLAVVLVLFLAICHVDAGKCRGRNFQEMRGREGFVMQRGCRGLDTQIQEDYWTTVGYDGILRDGRTTDDFMKFNEAENNGHSMSNSFVGYWITRTKYGENRHYEAFGHVFIKPSGRVCGWFVGLEKEVVEVCGGFRVLSRNRRNPYEPLPFEWVQGEQYRSRDVLGFHHHKIAKYELNGDEVFFGDADIKGKRFHGVYPATETFSQVVNPDEFHRKVWMLKKKSTPSDVRRPPVNIEEPPKRHPQDLDMYNDPHHEERIANMRMRPYYDEFGRPSAQPHDSHRPAYDIYGRPVPFQDQHNYSNLNNNNNHMSQDPQPGDSNYDYWLRNEYRIRGITPRNYAGEWDKRAQKTEENEQIKHEQGYNYEEAENEDVRTNFQVNPGPRVEDQVTIYDKKELKNEPEQNGATQLAQNEEEEETPRHVRLVRYRPQTIIRDKKGNIFEPKVINGKVVFVKATESPDGEPQEQKEIQITGVEPKIEEILENRRRQEEHLRTVIGPQSDYFSPKSAAEEARQG